MSFLKYASIIFLLLTGSNTLFAQINNIDSYQVALQQIRLISTEKSIIPFKNLEELSITHLVLGTPQVQTNVFSEQLDKYASVAHYPLPLQDDFKNLDIWLKSRKSAGDNAFIIEIWTDEDFTSSKLMQIKTLFEGMPVVLINFDTKYFDRKDDTGNAVKFDIQTLSGYWHQSLSAQLIFGGVSIENGKEAKGVRLGYSPIASVGMKSDILHDSIKSIIEQGIAARAFPGAQVLVARKGKIVYHEAFGKHTYEGEQKLSPDDIYDMASVTKVSSGLAALMKWYGEDKLNLDAPLSTYLPEAKGTNKADLKMRDILTHQARLRAWIPFWKGTLVGNSRNPGKKTGTIIEIMITDSRQKHSGCKHQKIILLKFLVAYGYTKIILIKWPRIFLSRPLMLNLVMFIPISFSYSCPGWLKRRRGKNLKTILKPNFINHWVLIP